MSEAPKVPAQPPDITAAVEADALEAARTATGDEAAQKESIAIRDEDYGPHDDRDSYGVRKALKEELTKWCGWIVGLGYWTTILILAFIAIMGGAYIWHLCWEPEKMKGALATMFTHALAILVGVFGKAYYGRKGRPN